MSALIGVYTISHVRIKSQLKRIVTVLAWSRDYSTKSSTPRHGASAATATVPAAGPLNILQQKCDANELKADEHQLIVMNELQQLYDTIQTYRPPEIRAPGLLSKWLPIKKERTKSTAPKGLYIYGSVGGGKTTLMDLFYNSCNTVRQRSKIALFSLDPFDWQLHIRQTKMSTDSNVIFFQISKKKRIHFNSFMTDVHAKIHSVKEEESKNLKYVGSDKANPFDPTKPVAEAITKDTWLLCFDEFQVRIAQIGTYVESAWWKCSFHTIFGYICHRLLILEMR